MSVLEIQLSDSALPDMQLCEALVSIWSLTVQSQAILFPLIKLPPKSWGKKKPFYCLPVHFLGVSTHRAPVLPIKSSTRPLCLHLTLISSLLQRRLWLRTLMD